MKRYTCGNTKNKFKGVLTMKFLKAITKDGSTEFFNMQNILSIKPCGNNYEDLKILMGAGVYWMVKVNTVEIVDLKDIIKTKE